MSVNIRNSAYFKKITRKTNILNTNTMLCIFLKQKFQIAQTKKLVS